MIKAKLGLAVLTGLIFSASFDCRPAQAQDADPIRDMKKFCVDKWGSDYRMQKYCREKQSQAALKVVERSKVARSDAEYTEIIGKCMVEWKNESGLTDWTMVEYCADKQYSAYKSLD